MNSNPGRPAHAGRKARATRDREEAAAKGMTPVELRQARAHRRRMMIAGARHKSTTAELSRIAAASNVQVTKCPPGCHSGWQPSWL